MCMKSVAILQIYVIVTIVLRSWQIFITKLLSQYYCQVLKASYLTVILFIICKLFFSKKKKKNALPCYTCYIISCISDNIYCEQVNTKNMLSRRQQRA